MSLLTRAGEQARAGRVRLKSDHLLYNSFYLALTTATMGVLGFLFWLLNARLFSASEIGKATLLISATSLISYLSLLGFNNTFIRFLPTAEDPAGHINTGLVLCFGTAIVLGSVYVLGLPLFAPELRFIRDSPWYALGFVLLTACSAVNLLTDSVFIAYRQARYNFIVDGLIQSGSKLSLPLLLVGLGTFGIFASAGIASALAVLFSLFFMKRIFDYRPAWEVKLHTVRSAITFSAASYLSNLLNLLPLLVLPVIVLDSLGAAAAGYYFLAFQMANLLFSVGYAVTESLLAEGSQAESDLTKLAKHSATVLIILVPTGGLVLAVSSHWLLLLFGRGYSQHASTALDGARSLRFCGSGQRVGQRAAQGHQAIARHGVGKCRVRLGHYRPGRCMGPPRPRVGCSRLVARQCRGQCRRLRCSPHGSSGPRVDRDRL